MTPIYRSRYVDRRWFLSSKWTNNIKLRLQELSCIKPRCSFEWPWIPKYLLLPKLLIASSNTLVELNVRQQPHGLQRLGIGLCFASSPSSGDQLYHSSRADHQRSQTVDRRSLGSRCSRSQGGPTDQSPSVHQALVIELQASDVS